MLAAKYRPQSWGEFVGNEKAISKLRRVIERPGFGGAAIWCDGPSGSGKTSLAHLVAKTVGAADIDVEEIDGDSCSVDRVRDLSRSINVRPMFGAAKVIIVNEAHAMTSRAVQAWLTLLERLPQHAVIVFTTTEESQQDLFGQFTQPLLSRCLHVELTAYGLKEAFAQRAKQIAEAEGLDGAPIGKYQRLIADCRNNFRLALSRIEMGTMQEGA